MTTAVCPRCKDRQATKVRGGLTVFHMHAAKGTSPRMWCRESGQPVAAAELERASSPSTASLHREMVEALRAHLDDPCGCSAAQARDDLDEHFEWCKVAKDRVALEGWEKRPRLAQDETLRRIVDGALRMDVKPEQRPVLVNRILSELGLALYGERG